MILDMVLDMKIQKSRRVRNNCFKNVATKLDYLSGCILVKNSINVDTYKIAKLRFKNLRCHIVILI